LKMIEISFQQNINEKDIFQYILFSDKSLAISQLTTMSRILQHFYIHFTQIR